MSSQEVAVWTSQSPIATRNYALAMHEPATRFGR